MKKINLGSYNVIIGQDILNLLANEIAKIDHVPSKILILIDNTVSTIYGYTINNLIVELKKNFSVYEYKMDSRERFKNLETVSVVYKFMSSINFCRQDLIISIGGGVTGDISGFIASTYTRGVKFVQIPTTLLAQVDSCVGSKNGVNFNDTKNLIGTFYDPMFVICDAKFLSTLPPKEISNGIAEVIKYGFISDPDILNILEKESFDVNNNKLIQELIFKCLKIKSDIIASDKFDLNRRILLNFGHTIGHAIERVKNFSRYSHGEAISIGMVLITKAAIQHNMSDKSILKRLISVLQKFSLPTEPQNLKISNIMKYVLRDKKRTGDKIKFVIVPDEGKALIHEINVQDIETFLSI